MLVNQRYIAKPQRTRDVAGTQDGAPSSSPTIHSATTQLSHARMWCSALARTRNQSSEQFRRSLLSRVLSVGDVLPRSAEQLLKSGLSRFALEVMSGGDLLRRRLDNMGGYVSRLL